MPDSIPAVGAEIKPPNTLGAFSNILGIKQQMLGIQQQQAQVGTAQAQEQQQQVQAQQLTAQHNFFQNFDPIKYLGSDGTIDMNNVAKSGVLKAAGSAAPEVWQKMLQIKQTQLKNQGTIANLNQTSRENLQQIIGGFRTDIDVISDNSQGRAKIRAAFDNFAALGPREAIVAKQYAPMVEHAPQGKLVQAVSAMQLQAQSAGQQSSTQAPGYFNAGGVAVQTNPQAAGGNLGSQGNIRTGVPPGMSTFTDSAGNVRAFNPQHPGESIIIGRGGGVPGAGPGGFMPPPSQQPQPGPQGNNPQASQPQPNSQPDSQPTNPLQQGQPLPPVFGIVGQEQNQKQQALVDQKAYSSAVSAGNEAPMTKNILQNIDKLAGESKTGPGSQYMADVETVLGQYVPGMQGAADAATKRQLLGKYVEQLAMRVTQANGYATDDARGMVAHAIPNPEAMTPQAMQQAARFIQAQTDIGQARSSFAQNYNQQHGSSAGFQQADANFMSNIDPRMFDLLGLNRGQQEQTLQKMFGNDKASEAEFLRKAAVIRKLGGFDYSTQGRQ